MALYTQGRSLIRCNSCVLGESIEEKMRKVTTTGEPIEETVPMIFTERKDGVQPQYDIRTDRFEIALDAMDKVNRSNAAKSAEQAKVPAPAEPGTTQTE